MNQHPNLRHWPAALLLSATATLPLAAQAQTTDTTAPTLTETTPPARAIVNTLTTVRGTVTEEAGGSGINRVVLAIFRVSDGKWWNGTTYGPTFTELPTTRVGNNWEKNSGLPTGANLTDSEYVLASAAYDNAGNRRQLDTTIRVDQTAPATLSFTNPVNGSTVNRLDSINGRVEDAPNGSGIARVQVALRRASDGFYWNGTTWVATQFLLPAQSGGAFFQITSGLPTPDQLSNGNYSVTAFATDNAGNNATQTSMFSVLIDNVAPQVTIDVPADNAALPALPFVRGTVQDNDGGSGVSRVVLALLRNSDQKWWNGTAWVDAFSELTTTLNGTTWQRDGGLPSGGDLTDGQYTLEAQAFDNFGNLRRINSSVLIDSVAPSAITFTSPTDNTPADGILINRLTAISGTVADNAGGSGITDVKLTLRRSSDGLYWNGTAWVAEATALDTTNGGGFFDLSTNLPSGDNLPRDTYTVAATAFDAAGNRSTSALAFQVVPDFVVPAPIITTPANDAVVRELPIVRGTAVDNPGGVGIDRVTLAIFRIADRSWWNGTSFTPDFFELPTDFSDGTWQRTTGLPAGDDLRNGLYALIAISYDKLGNRTQSDTTTRNTIRVDRAAPTALTIDTPVANGLFGTFPFITGTAQDDQPFGLRDVTINIRRLSDGLFWNGSDWVTEAALLPTNLDQRTIPGQWSSAFTPPRGRQLPSSNYVITALATDFAGNSRSAQTEIRIIADNTPPLVYVDTLRNGAVLRALPVVSGRVTDAGSGVARVQIALNRRSDNRWWNGSEWVATATFLDATRSGDNWTANNLPTGVNVADGAYLLLAVGIDSVGNRRQVDVNFSIDRTAPPTVTFGRPTANSRVTNLSPIGGTAFDTRGGSGIASVNVQIRRAADNFYWNGQAWRPTPTLLAATLSPVVGGVRWVRSGAPSGVNLTPGLYALFATATDRAGNATTRGISVRALDATKPVITITSPTNGQLQRVFPPITGTLVDNVPGSGSVQLVIKRGSDGFYWNGTAWSATPASLPATVEGTVWRRTTGLPSGTNLRRDVYTVQAIGRDASTNRADAIIRIPINPDFRGPALTLAAPANGATLPAFGALRGTVDDGPTGSGVQRVIVAIRRDIDGLWWNGRTWIDTFSPLATVVSGTNWSLTQNLPPSDATPTGAYTIIVQAFDKLGNQSQISRNVTINPNPAPNPGGGGGTGGGVTNPVIVSSAEASAAADTVRLSWTTTLDPTTAQGITYTAVVNGNSVPVLSIADTPGAVTLGLDADLKAGDSIIVRWTVNGFNGERSTTVIAK